MSESGLSDDDLMQRVAVHNPAEVRERAFRALVERHARALSAQLSSVVPDRVEREDLLQETFLRVFMAKERYEPGKASFRSWLFVIGANLARNSRRNRGTRREQPLTGELTDPRQADPAQRLLETQRALRVGEAIDRLAELDREVVTLHFYKGQPYAEIAELMGSSAAAIKQRAWRALRALRCALGRTETP